MDDLAMNITFVVSFSSSLMDNVGLVVNEKFTFVILLMLLLLLSVLVLVLMLLFALLSMSMLLLNKRV